MQYRRVLSCYECTTEAFPSASYRTYYKYKNVPCVRPLYDGGDRLFVCFVHRKTDNRKTYVSPIRTCAYDLDGEARVLYFELTDWRH